MSHTQSGILAALQAGKTLLVPNARAAELIRERYSLKMAQDGCAAWPSASVLPWRVWLADYYLRTDIGGPALLSTEQALLLWEQVVSEERDLSIQQVGQFTRLAADAWATSHLWQIPLSNLAQRFPSFEVGLFANWQQKFRRRCNALAVIDTYTMATELLARWQQHTSDPPAHLGERSERCLVGYAAPPPLLKALGAHYWQISASPGELLEQNTTSGVTTPTLNAYNNETLELRAAVKWALSVKQASPDAAVAIALSNPPLLRNALTEGLRRYRFACDDEALRALASNVNLIDQQSLGQLKLVQSALRVLNLGEQLSCDDATALLLDPYIGEWQEERTQRARLDRDIRNEVRDLTLSTDYFLTLASHTDYALENFHQRFVAMRNARDDAAHRQSLIDWQAQFENELELMNWPAGEYLTHQERAAKDAWQQALDGLVGLSPLTGMCTRRHALHRLNVLLQQRVFNPPSAAHGIRVISFDEAPLYAADAIAWCGLGQHQWPLQTAINPLLPYALQREAKVPGTNLGFDARNAQLELLQALTSVPNSRCSYTALVEDVENPPVSMFENVIEEIGETSPSGESFTAAEFEEIDDRYGLPLAAEVSLRNAVRFFADQGACPFRAYAVHRLASQSVEAPALGLDPRRRGELVHLAIARLWARLGSQTKLAAKTNEQVRRLIEQTVSETVAEYRRHSRQLPQYWELEAARLQGLLSEWLAVEAKREAFEVLDTEKALAAEIAEFRFRIRVDRIDRLADGSVAVIDFKTGKDSPASWAAPRIEQPQLPIYAVNLAAENVSAIAYAQIRSGECRFVELPRAALSKGARAEDWQQQLQAWRDDLYTRAEKMASGFAEVDPKRGATTCRYCDQRVLCRIGAAVDDDAADTPNTDVDV